MSRLPDVMTELYSLFEPFQPPVKEAYVDCNEVRGKWDVLRELGRKIERSKEPTCQLYSGHRGVGKSTELLRLKEELEKKDFFVVYFAADSEDVEQNDTEYADILFACTRHLVQAIQLENHNPLLDWMKDRWQSLRDLATTEFEFEGASLEAQVAQFASITANLRAVPDKRRELRQRIDANTPSLVMAMNAFIDAAQAKLAKEGKRGIVVMADNLDRIVEKQEEGKPSNYDEIYLNRSELLRGLNCHVIYTVPISMIYSERGTRLEDSYDKPDVLPMVMMRYPNGDVHEPGVDAFREIIRKRVEQLDRNMQREIEQFRATASDPQAIAKHDPLAPTWETTVFDSPDTIRHLCLASGGHLRILMQLIQRALDWLDELPITAQAVQISIEETKETYRNTIQEGQWDVLAEVCYHKLTENNEQRLRLLLNRCLLEYRYYDDNGMLRRWRDVHPLIRELEPFQRATRRIEAAANDTSS